MTTHQLPESGMLVEITQADEPVGGVRVVRAVGQTLTLSMPLAAVPSPGAAVTLRWPAGSRGRYSMIVTVVAIDENRIDVQAAGQATIEQDRHFVRGGGGERVLMRRAGLTDAYGWIRDISEQGVRAHFSGVELAEGDDLALVFELGNELVQVEARAAKVARMRQQVPPGPMSVELVATFHAAEPQARAIRRYVMRQQLLTRTRA